MKKLKIGGIFLKREEKRERIAILDFGSQYTQLIARRVREAKVYSEIFPYYVELSKLLENPLKELSYPEGQPAYIRITLPHVIKRYLN